MACYAILYKSPRHLTTSKEEFKAMIFIAVVECADCIQVI